MAKLTDKELNSNPKDKDVWLYDGAISKGHGELCLRITPGGSRRFYFRYTGPNGERVRLPLGVYDPTGEDSSIGAARLTLKAARKKAAEFSLLHQNGTTNIKEHLEAELRLAEAQRAAEEARLEAERAAEQARLEAEKKAAEIEASRLTVEGLFEKWESLRLSQRKDGKEIRRIFEKDVLPAIGHLPAHTIRKGHIVEITDNIELRKANRLAKIVFTSLRTMFRFALERDFIEGDPTANIRKAVIGGENVERDRTLTDDEIKLLSRQMPASGLSPTARAAAWIALSTGCRIGELMKARWEHIDLERRRWLIPSENSKNKIPLEVYLSDFALEQFKVLKQHRRAEWLFPARFRDKETGAVRDTHVCTKTVTKQIGDRQRARIKTKGTKDKGTLVLPGGFWTPHDLRRTASTIMGGLGIKPEVIDRCQNHKEPNRIRRTYQQYPYQPEMKEAWQLLGERLEALTSGQEAAEVIPLRRPA